MTRKFTSEDLLNAMGLKVGQTLKFNHGIFKLVVGSKKNIIILQSEHKDMGLGILIDEEYEIIQPKPTLTEETKIVLNNLDKRIKWILFQEESLYGYDYEPTMVGNLGCYYISDTFDLDCIKHLLIDLKELTPYSIEELLGESV